MYVKMVRDGKAQEYMDKYVFGPKDHMEYLDLIGGRKLIELQSALSLKQKEEADTE